MGTRRSLWSSVLVTAQGDGMLRRELIFLHSASGDGCNDRPLLLATQEDFYRPVCIGSTGTFASPACSPGKQVGSLPDRVHRPARGAIAVGIVLEVRLKDWFQHKLGGGLNHPIANRRNAERTLASSVRLRIIPRRTGSGRYVFETSSSRRPPSHASRPDASICAKLIPSTPAAPAFAARHRIGVP